MIDVNDMTFIQGVMGGVIANGITAVAFSHIKEAKDKLFSINLVSNTIKNDDNVKALIQKTLTEIGKQFNATDLAFQNKIKLFLVSPELESIIRQYYSNIIDNSATLDTNKTDIETKFKLLFMSYTNIAKIDKFKLRAMYSNIIKTCDRAISIASTNGSLSSHETMSSIRHRIICDELKSISKSLVTYKGIEKIGIEQINDYEKKYRCQLNVRTKDIKPPHFDEQKRIPIDDIYIAPRFKQLLYNKPETINSFSYTEFLSIAYRSVVLGSPGNGKTTLIQKICNDLCRGDNRLYLNRQLTPVPVVLRDYLASKQQHGCTLLKYIEISTSKLVQLESSSETFDYLLQNGRVVVLFDGLDELLETSKRQDVCGDIEVFCNIYPSTPVLVTSRKVGYEQASLDTTLFDLFQMDTFDTDQVKEYVFKWFATDAELDQEEQHNKASSFIIESDYLQELTENPLMLSLMCNIYKGDKYIPKNRPDIYRKCSEMLFDKWDKLRDIEYKLPFERSIKPIIMHIAYWILSDNNLQPGVKEDILTKRFIAYIKDNINDDDDYAVDAATQLINFCKGRAWVFTDTGNKIYQFTHRTFLEYYSASYIARTNETCTMLDELLYSRILSREWDVIIQLAYQIKNESYEGAIDELIVMLLNRCDAIYDASKYNILSFVARSLHYVTPKPYTIKLIVQYIVDTINDPHNDLYVKLDNIATEAFVALLTTYGDNAKIVDRYLEEILNKSIQCGTGVVQINAIRLASNLHIILRTNIYNSSQYSRIKELSDRITDSQQLIISELSKQYYELCYYSCARNYIDIIKAIDYHGIVFIYKQVKLDICEYTYLAYLYELLRGLTKYEYSMNDKYCIEILEHIANSYSNKAPTIYSNDIHIDNLSIVDGLNAKTLFNSLIAYGSKSIYGCFIIFAILHETGCKLDSKTMPLIILSRYSPQEPKLLKSEIDSFGFTTDDEDVVYEWIRGNMSFVI